MCAKKLKSGAVYRGPFGLKRLCDACWYDQDEMGKYIAMLALRNDYRGDDTEYTYAFLPHFDFNCDICGDTIQGGER